MTITIISAYPASSVQVLDILTKKPIENAKVTINTTQKFTDSLGLAVLDVPNGSYTLNISHPSYWSKTLKITLPMTEPLKAELIPLWSIGLGIVAGVTIITAVAAKAMWK